MSQCPPPAFQPTLPSHSISEQSECRTATITFFPPRSLSDIAVRDEAQEVRPDPRPQARKNRRRIRWNTLRIFQGRERHRWSRIVRRSRKVNVGQAPRISLCRAITMRSDHSGGFTNQVRRTTNLISGDPGDLSPQQGCCICSGFPQASQRSLR